MAEFRKKPVVIEAFQVSGAEDIPVQFAAEAIMVSDVASRMGVVAVKTRKGIRLASPGDWIVRDEKGRFSVMPPDLFAATFDAVVSPAWVSDAMIAMAIGGIAVTSIDLAQIYAEPAKPEARPDWPLPSFDSRDWAKAFCETPAARGYSDPHGKPIDVEWMQTWFANALMRGYDEGQTQVLRDQGEEPCQKI